MKTVRIVQLDMVYLRIIIFTQFQKKIAGSNFHLKNAAGNFRLDNVRKLPWIFPICTYSTVQHYIKKHIFNIYIVQWLGCPCNPVEKSQVEKITMICTHLSNGSCRWHFPNEKGHRHFSIEKTCIVSKRLKLNRICTVLHYTRANKRWL